MAGKKGGANRFKQPVKPAGRTLGLRHLLPVLILLLLLFFGLEWLKRGHRPATAPEPAAKSTFTSVQEPREDYQQQYTAVRQKPKVSAMKQRDLPKGSLAIVIDDMGSSLKEVQDLVAINQPFTFAIIPGLPKAVPVAEYAHANGRDVIIHIPMEPQGYPAQRVESNALLMSSPPAVIEERVSRFIRDIPHAIGANNHMGSRFTENHAQMKPVISILKSHGLFFLDSRTSPRSVAMTVAKEMGVRTASRSIFLDNEPSVDAVKRELEGAARQAAKRGGVIAICHPHPYTIQALRETIPKLAAEGTVFVKLSDLIN